MKILVMGADGQLGQQLIYTAQVQQVVGVSRAQCDITQREQVRATLQISKPTLVINAAAYTQVDRAEQEPILALQVNCVGAANLALSCAEYNIPLLHVSTDYVFSGTQTIPYTEADIAAPINVYGHTKFAGEEAVRRSGACATIVRVSGLFSSYGNNFVKTILRLAQERTTLRIVNDNAICPTSTQALAVTLLQISAKLHTNASAAHVDTYHFCSAEAVSWHQFATAIVAQAAQHTTLQAKEIIGISSADYPTPAARPRYSVLDSTQLQKAFGVAPPDWRTDLSHVLTRIFAA